jgi:hypothetical protein
LCLLIVLYIMYNVLLLDYASMPFALSCHGKSRSRSIVTLTCVCAFPRRGSAFFLQQKFFDLRYLS